MKVTAINGSPKGEGQSMSGSIIGQIEKLLGGGVKTYRAAQLVRTQTSPEVLADMLNADTLLIVFPLYVDSLPAPLIEVLERLEDAGRSSAIKPRVYAVANCGYFESEHTRLALEMVEHFARRAGLPWGYGLGIGGGPMLGSMGDNWEKGPASAVYHALCDMASAMQNGKTGENIFAVPKFPRVFYKAIANFGWRVEARRNGAGKLRTRPYAGNGGSPL